MAEKSPPGPPMDLANMRENSIRGLRVTCLKCGVACVLNVDGYDDSLTVNRLARAWSAKPAGPRVLTCGPTGQSRNSTSRDRERAGFRHGHCRARHARLA